MKAFLGIDGGATGSRALLVDWEGTVRWWGKGPAANCRGMDFGAFLDVLDRHHQAALKVGFKISGVGLGLTGIVTRDWAKRIAAACASRWGMNPANLLVEPDIRSAHRGGLRGKPGIALISGTGSSCLGRDPQGNWHQCGGWGGLLDDGGSGYGISLEGCRLAVRMADGRASRTPLLDGVFTHFGKTTLPDLVEYLHDSGLKKGDLASLFPRILELAVEGDPAAQGLIKNGIRELVDLVRTSADAIGESQPDLVVTGGLLEAPGPFRQGFEQALKTGLPGHRILPSALPAAAGAILGLQEGWKDAFAEGFVDQIQRDTGAIRVDS